MSHPRLAKLVAKHDRLLSLCVGQDLSVDVETVFTHRRLADVSECVVTQEKASVRFGYRCLPRDLGFNPYLRSWQTGRTRGICGEAWYWLQCLRHGSGTKAGWIRLACKMPYIPAQVQSHCCTCVLQEQRPCIK